MPRKGKVGVWPNRKSNGMIDGWMLCVRSVDWDEKGRNDYLTLAWLILFVITAFSERVLRVMWVIQYSNTPSRA
jgi:hypothetical protein